MKRERIQKVVLVVVFIGLLFVPLVVRRFARHHAAAQTRMSETMAMTRYGFYLTEVSKAAGVNFVHQGPKLDPQLNAIMPEVASMGASVSIVDFDRDGWPDIYVTDSRLGGRNALYRNMHDGTFKNVADQMGIADVNQQGTGSP